MSEETSKIGNIIIIWGKKSSRYPYCNSIYIPATSGIVIDPASNPEILSNLARKGIDTVINSHFHFDHVRFNHFFNNSNILVHQNDQEAMSDLYSFAKKYGALRIHGSWWIEELIDTLNYKKSSPDEDCSFTYDNTFYQSIGRITSTYSGGDVLRIDGETIEILHIPGHSDSMCCFYFPEQSLCYVSDYNVKTDWGPWYGGEDSDIEDMICSAEKLRKLDADLFITAHDPFVLDRREFLQSLKSFLNVVNTRNELIMKLMDNGLTFDEISNLGIFYKKKYLDIPWVKAWETMMLIKHFEYMGKEELVPDKYACPTLPNFA